VEPSFKFLSKSKIHPYFTFTLKDNFRFTEFDLISGWRAKDSNDPDKIFNQLIKETKKSTEKIEIYTDGSKTKATDCEEGVDLVGCAILVPHISKSFSFKLNSLTSSFMAEVFAIVKALQLIDSYS